MKTNTIISLILVMSCSLYSSPNWARENRGQGGGHPGFSGGQHNQPGFGGSNRNHPGFGGGRNDRLGFRGDHHDRPGFGGGYYGHRDFDDGYRHGNPRFGFYFGAPFYRYPYPYYRPYFRPYYRPYYPYPYYPPAIVTVPIRPPVYIQQPAPAIQNYPSGYWYYCNNPEGYYPYIKECLSGWQQVKPIPPAPR
ncbi:MAG: hypothetical protein PHR16_02260 [Methylovulum sp.]|nr:hypothetical protein [Methylovulum sp.]